MNGSNNANHISDTPRTTSTWTTITSCENCRNALHKSPFTLQHQLSGSPLFTLDSLVEVAQDAAKRRGDLYYDAGTVSLSDRWGNIPIPNLPVSEVIRRIQTEGAWIIMKHVESDPRFKEILESFTDFIRDIAGPIQFKLFRNPEMLIIITSPNRVTHFHFDAEINFLVQVSGSKELWVCDPNDRTITTETEIERYYAATTNSYKYKPHAEGSAMRFSLQPGDAVHIPSHGAHWVKNHDNVSVSLSLNYEFPRWKQAAVYQANHYIRRLGFTPRPPGRSIIVDRAKAVGVAITRTAVRGLRAVRVLR